MPLHGPAYSDSPVTPPLPLDHVRFGWRSHLAALWWLGLLYRKPSLFWMALTDLEGWHATACGVKLYLHAVPWIVALCLLLRSILHGVLGLQSDVQAMDPAELILGHLASIAVGIAVLRAYYLLPNILFVWPKPRARWYPFHPVAWDDLCSVAFPGLERLLVAYAEAFPEAGEREIKRLIDEYPSQRGPGLKARTIMLARQCARLSRLAEVSELAARLPEGDRGYLAQTPRVREMIVELSRLQTRLDTVTRPFFREPLARAQQQLDEARTVLAKSRTPQVFRAGDPVDRDQEAFVERNEVVGEVEGQIMLATGCPGLILYGRRRVGSLGYWRGATTLRN